MIHESKYCAQCGGRYLVYDIKSVTIAPHYELSIRDDKTVCLGVGLKTLENSNIDLYVDCGSLESLTLLAHIKDAERMKSFPL